MTKVSVSTWVKVKDGPDLAANIELDPETVTQARVSLDAAGGAAPQKTVELLPAGGSVALLARTVTDAANKPAQVTVTPANGADTGTPIQVLGALVVASSGVLAEVVVGGPRSLTLTNAEAHDVTVHVIAARSD